MGGQKDIADKIQKQGGDYLFAVKGNQERLNKAFEEKFPLKELNNPEHDSYAMSEKSHGTRHDGYYETAITAGSSTVFIDGLPAARQGDPLTPHDKPKPPPHPRKIARGSSTVFIDGLPAARTGDAIDCGGVVIGGGTVNIG